MQLIVVEDLEDVDGNRRLLCRPVEQLVYFFGRCRIVAVLPEVVLTLIRLTVPF